jgi:programmed cell death protein 5
MDKLTPANLKSEELPAGFSSADPNNAASGADAEAHGEDEQKQAILQQALTPDALARLRRIKLVKPERVTKIENQIVSLALQGKLPGPINEGRIIEMLERMGMNQSAVATNKISIQRKKYAFDSDDEEDNDDDLM